MQHVTLTQKIMNPGEPQKVAVTCGNNEIVLKVVKDDGVQRGNIFILKGKCYNNPQLPKLQVHLV